jgi:nucleoside-diphosphate-sugar epimerase
MKIIIAGATGLIGKKLVECLVNRDDVEIIYCISRKKENIISNKVVNITANIVDKILEIEMCDVVINCAGEKNIESEMYKTNVTGALNLFNLANSANVKTFIHISSVGSYGATRFSGEINENTHLEPKNYYEKTKYIAEKKLLVTSKRENLRLIILQPSNIIDIDTNEKSALPLLIKLANNGIGIKICKSDGWLNFIPLNYLVQKINEFVDYTEASGRIIINCPIKYSEVLLIISNTLHKRIIYLYIPQIVEVFVDYIIKIFKIGRASKLILIKNKMYEINNNVYFKSIKNYGEFSKSEIISMYKLIVKQNLK